MNHQQAWAVALAGGDGTRLRPLTRSLYGEDRPKQFCRLYGGETLLKQTRARLAGAVDPERTAFVLVEAHEKFYRGELADVEPHQLIVQPTNKGTTAAVICSLLRITRMAGDPVVAFFPTDHFYGNEAQFVASVDQALRVAQNDSRTLVILGAEAEHAEVEYGWIEPRSRCASRVANTLHRVNRFWEKPSHPLAQTLMARGCLWNMFVMIGRVSIFLTLIEKLMPFGVSEAFEAGRRGGRVTDSAAQELLWTTLSSGDFSRQVLTPSAQQLAVLRVGDLGWSDLGTPERVRAAVARIEGALRQESEGNENSEAWAKTIAG